MALGTATSAILFAQLPVFAAGSELSSAATAPRGARQRAFLVGQRCRWVAPRCHQLLLSRPGATGQSTQAARRAQDAGLQSRESIRLSISSLRQHAAREPAVPDRAARVVR